MMSTNSIKVSPEQTYPALNGYGLGSMIQKGFFLRPQLLKQQSALKVEIEALKKIEEGMNQAQVIEAYCARENKTLELKNVDNRLAALPTVDHFETEEMLPIITERSPIEMHKRSFSGEKFHHLIISQDSNGNNASTIALAIREFLFQLRSEETQTASNLSSETIDSLSNNIWGIVKSGHKVSLIGSFLTLPRVRVMDPIVLRKEAVSSAMVENATKYSVITEMVLGALFIGYGRSLSIHATSEEEPATSRIMAGMSVFSFISQGAIPRMRGKFEDANLWEVYLSWKEALSSDKDSGYPIAIRVRDLTDILKENKIETKSITETKDRKET